MFISHLRNLIKTSDLQYLSRVKRRKILSEATSLEVESINQQVYKLFKWMDIEWYLDYWRVTEYHKILLVYNICESVSDVDKILFNPHTEGLFNFPFSIFKKIISLCKCKWDIITIARLSIIEKVLYSENLDIFWIMLWFVNSVEELEELSDNEDFTYLCVYISDTLIVQKVLNHFDIKSFKDIKKIFNSWKWEHLKKLMRNWSIEQLDEVLYMDTSHVISIPDNLVWFNKELKVNTCEMAEYFNMRILIDRKVTSYICIIYNWCVLWYVKQVWVPSFLALRDVFTKSWVLIMKQGMIYALANAEEIIEDLEIWEQQPIQVNPIRMLDIDKLNNLMQSDRRLEVYIREFLNRIE